MHAINGTEERLDAVLDELRGLRADLAARPSAPVNDLSPTVAALVDQVELREPAKVPPAPPTGKRTRA